MAHPTNKIEKAALISKKIRFLLQNQSLTVKEFASQLSVTREHLTEIVDGRTLPTRHLLQKICWFFAVKPEFFGAAAHDIMFEDPPAAQVANNAESAMESLGIEAPATASEAESPQPARKKRKFDLAELAAHHQALLECLIESKALSSEKYTKKVEDVRKRAKLD